ncbi:FHA domain-containing protein [uncultured Cohaesibacter sp.]|uniref:FHA domain-containing protein n=1 Tax=uncultured Cohaesibacter sp. TaxID=1002546 RepID=UPI002AA7F102|nr:FHA domain-containing protein [uncultured Cohaesibacter sp.]
MAEKQEKVLARISLAAMAVDFLVIAFLTEILLDFFKHDIWVSAFGNAGNAINDAPYIPAFLLALLLHLFVTEVLAGGYSLGRMCMGLSIRDLDNNSPPRFIRRLKRVSSIVAVAGLRSLNLNSLAPHNKSRECCLHSDWIGACPDLLQTKTTGSPLLRSKIARPKQEAVSAESARRSAGVLTSISVVSGPDRGKRMPFNKGRMFKEQGIFTIGRSADQVDLALTNDPTVSRVHCCIMLRNGAFHIKDGSYKGKAGSTHGTFVDNQTVDAAKTMVLDGREVIKVGSNFLRLIR